MKEFCFFVGCLSFKHSFSAALKNPLPTSTDVVTKPQYRLILILDQSNDSLILAFTVKVKYFNQNDFRLKQIVRKPIQIGRPLEVSILRSFGKTNSTIWKVLKMVAEVLTTWFSINLPQLVPFFMVKFGKAESKWTNTIKIILGDPGAVS